MRAMHAPFGYFFLPESPVEPMPMPDMLDTVYVCQERQSWYREHAKYLPKFYSKILHKIGYQIVSDGNSMNFIYSSSIH